MALTVERTKEERLGSRGCCVDVGAIMGEIRKAPVDRQHTLLGALADPTRLQMAHLLARTDELCVCDFTAAFDVGQPTVSHHLRVLREAGIVTSRKAGQWVYYTLDRTALKWLVGTLLEMM